MSASLDHGSLLFLLSWPVISLTIDLPNVNGPSGLDLQAEYMLFNAQTGKSVLFSSPCSSPLLRSSHSDQLVAMRDDRNGEDEYVVDLKFFKPISPSHTKIFFTPTSLCLLLRKADAGEEYWPRLREGANEFKWLERDAEKVHFALHPICSETYFVIRRKALTNLFLVVLQWVVQADQNESNRIDESGFVSINTPNLGRPPPGMARHLSLPFGLLFSHHRY